jgi:hypothetical protein
MRAEHRSLRQYAVASRSSGNGLARAAIADVHAPAFASDEPRTSMLGDFFWPPDEPMTSHGFRVRRAEDLDAGEAVVLADL